MQQVWNSANNFLYHIGPHCAAKLRACVHVCVRYIVIFLLLLCGGEGCRSGSLRGHHISLWCCQKLRQSLELRIGRDLKSESDQTESRRMNTQTIDVDEPDMSDCHCSTSNVCGLHCLLLYIWRHDLSTLVVQLCAVSLHLWLVITACIT